MLQIKYHNHPLLKPDVSKSLCVKNSTDRFGLKDLVVLHMASFFLKLYPRSFIFKTFNYAKK
jgi:hypothetical protein